MRFYNRESELENLALIKKRSLSNAQMTVMVGRRRIGKTSLIKKSIELDTNAVYFFVAKKSEHLLCAEFLELIRYQLNKKPHGEITGFSQLFAWLMDISKEMPFTLAIDEFQEFLSINPSIMSEMQNIWDSKKEGSQINLILCGSIYSLMKRIFENSKEPLFSRATSRMNIKPFRINVLKEILQDQVKNISYQKIFPFYIFTGGVAKYVENLIMAEAFDLESILNEIFRENSLFLDEGKNVLIDELGKDYHTHFSILTLIASSKTSRTEIESILGGSIGGFLDRLENEYQIIEKVRPILAKPNSRKIKYQIKDNFLTFWFRFIYKNRSAIEIGNYEYVKEIVKRDFDTFSGLLLERYFRQQFEESGNYSMVGNYWEKGNLNEIDLIAINELEKKIILGEIKLNKKKIDLKKLESKSEKLLKDFKDYKIEYLKLSLEDIYPSPIGRRIKG
ncbi:MAG: ATP-binding protein [Bacteroidota bacterium]